MTCMRSIAIVCVCAWACKSSEPPRFEGPMPIGFGDCAASTVVFVSGPRPRPERDDTTPAPGGAFASATGFDDANIYGGLVGNQAPDADNTGGFGFGRSGYGPGGSWGTIGHGNDSAGRRRRTGAVPTVSIGQPNTQGDLDKAIIRRYIKRNIQKLTYCYEKQLLTKPGLAGTVSTQFFIAPNGTVTSSQASGVDPEVADCVAGVIRNIEFPKPKGGGGVQVNYPFTFRPVDGTPPPPPLPAAPPPPPPPAAQPPPPVAPPPAAGRSVYRARSAPRVEAPGELGRDNPLRAEEAALAECLRKNPQHAGVAVVELGYDASGTTIFADVYGIDDERTRACVVDTAKRARRVAGGRASERCALGFGTMSATQLPGFDITSDAIAMAGKQLDDPTAALVARRDAALAANAPVVSLYGPLAIRAEPTAPMKSVMRVVKSVAAADDDFVLAARQGAEWELVEVLALPVPPVPIGTGGRWGRVKLRAQAGSGDDRVVLSILVTKKETWVDLSRVGVIQQLPYDGSSRLVTTLKEHKASAFFADRYDAEIAADDDVPYAQFVEAVDAAIQAGFVDWQLTSRDALTAPPS